MMKSPRIMFFYAGFLLACGVIAYIMAPADANPMTALLVSSIAAGLMVVFGAMASALHRNRTVGMIGIHVGLALPLLYTLAFGFQAYRRFATAEPGKLYLPVILTIMAIGSIAAFVMILKTRPPMDKRGPST